MRRTANIMPFESRMTEPTGFVPLPQGKTHFPGVRGSRHEEPGPRTGSYPAPVARLWIIVKVETVKDYNESRRAQVTAIHLHIGIPWIVGLQCPFLDNKRKEETHNNSREVRWRERINATSQRTGGLYPTYSSSLRVTIGSP
jgi:hypothetical protein